MDYAVQRLFASKACNFMNTANLRKVVGKKHNSARNLKPERKYEWNKLELLRVLKLIRWRHDKRELARFFLFRHVEKRYF